MASPIDELEAAILEDPEPTSWWRTRLTWNLSLLVVTDVDLESAGDLVEAR